MMNASGVVPSIKSDRAGGPWVELWGDWLQRIDVLESTLPLPFGDMGCVYHVHHAHLRGEALLSSVVRRSGLLLVIATQSLVSGFGT